MPWRELRSSFVFTVVALLLVLLDGYRLGAWSGALEALFTTAVLALLEVSLSVDNAIVNAAILKRMSPLWQKRFMTWGILTAVFGMRVVFPLVVVSLAARVTPLAALRLALFQPDHYAQLMLSSHLRLIGFGSAFLFMVFVYYFFDREKEEHWLGPFERVMSWLGRVPFLKPALFALLFSLSSLLLAPEEQLPFLVAAICGLGAFLLLHALTSWLKVPKGTAAVSGRMSLYLFIYLELLDASFSFDGVIGGFALTHDLVILAFGLGIGAMYVRGLTIWMVRKNTLSQFKYLEHGAFYAIGVLALLMLLDLTVPVPELMSGGVGLLILGVSLLSSLRKPAGRVKA